MAALLAETAEGRGKPWRARTRGISEEPVKALPAAASPTTEEQEQAPHVRTGAEVETALAIAKLRAAAWDPETAAPFPAPPTGVQLAPAVPAAHRAWALVVAEAIVAEEAVVAGEGGDSLTKEGQIKEEQ